MKIVCISDIHSQFFGELPEGDILVIAGDLTAYGRMKEYITLNNWLQTLDFKRIIVTAGNHCQFIYDFPQLAKETLNAAELYLHEPFTFEVDGKEFNGFASPYSKRFGNWVYMHYDNEEGERLWSQVPEDTDLLITHGPPYGILDRILPIRQRVNEDIYVGSKTLLRTVQKIKPKIHVFGHIHNQNGTLNRAGTLFVNAAICSEEYKPTQSPIVLDLFVAEGELQVKHAK